MSALGQWAGRALQNSGEPHRFLQLRLRVGAAWSNLRLILEMDWLGRFDRRQVRIVGTQRGPRVNRAGAPRQGDGGLMPRFTHWDLTIAKVLLLPISTAHVRHE